MTAVPWMDAARALLAEPGCSLRHYRVRGVSLVEAANPDGSTRWGRFADADGSLTEPEGWGTRPCEACGRVPVEVPGSTRGPMVGDGCLPVLPGVIEACCGHGTREPYAVLEDGTVLQGEAARRLMREHGGEPPSSSRDPQPESRLAYLAPDREPSLSPPMADRAAFGAWLASRGLTGASRREVQAACVAVGFREPEEHRLGPAALAAVLAAGT